MLTLGLLGCFPCGTGMTLHMWSCPAGTPLYATPAPPCVSQLGSAQGTEGVDDAPSNTQSVRFMLESDSQKAVILCHALMCEKFLLSVHVRIATKVTGTHKVDR